MHSIPVTNAHSKHPSNYLDTGVVGMQAYGSVPRTGEDGGKGALRDLVQRAASFVSPPMSQDTSVQ